MKNKYYFVATFLFFLFGFSILHAQVVINEVQTSNFGSIQDENGSYGDWIELYNTDTLSIDLTGYGLSNNASKPFKFTFPSFNLLPHDHVLIFADNTENTLIGTHWESAAKASDSWRYRANTTAATDTNWRNLSFNDAVWSCGKGAIGYGDGDDSTVVPACISVYMRKTFSIVDTSKILDGVFNMDYDDGFVAYLNGVEIARVNIGQPGIRPLWNNHSVAAFEAQMYQHLPCDSVHLSQNFLRGIIKNGTNVLAIETHNIVTNDNDLSSIPFLSFRLKDSTTMFSPVPAWFPSTHHPKDYFHAAFKLSKTGETIFLTNASATLVDQIAVPDLELDNSYARNTDGENLWKYFSTATPDTANSNSNGYSGYATIPLFSLQAGFYTGTQTLTITTAYPGGVIRYTTNGNLPNASSPLYNSPISITHTTAVRARVFSATSCPSETVTNTYFINLDCKLPVYSIALDSADLWDYNTGIFVKGPNASPNSPYLGANYWQDWEKYMSLEYYDKQKNRAFKFNAALSITGGWSRRFYQKSLEVKLNDRFGLSKIQYDLLPDKSWITKWDDFLLHNTGNDCFVAHIRDPIMERLMRGTNSDYTSYEPCLLYINGAQWGVYYTKENDDDNFVKAEYGYRKDQIDLLKESYLYPDIEIKCGSDTAFRAMYNFAMHTNPSLASFYSGMDSLIELKNLTDYFSAECYYPNDDWMGGVNNNLKMWRPKKTGGRFRYILYDLDFGFGMYGQPSDDILAIALNPNPHNYNSDIFQKLLQNTQFKNYFINRYADLINTTWLPTNVSNVVSGLQDSMRYDMHFQYDKWGGGDTNTWKTNVNAILTFSSARPAYARNQIQSDLGMTGQVTLTLQASPDGAGRIQISTITPSTLPWSGVYFNGNPVTITAIPNSGYTFNHWFSNVAITASDTNKSVTRNFTSSDVITAYFTGSSVSPQITISEINYNSDSASNAGDWFELHNLSSVDLDISAWKIRDDNDHHEFVFPLSTILSANNYLVVSEDTQKFHLKHPSVLNVIGELGFNLSNGGDQIRVFQYNDSLYLSLEYRDQYPWATSPDGGGYTLELKSSSGDLNDGNNWFAGCLGGSPGTAFNGPLAIFTTSGATMFCSDDTLVLSASQVPDYTYQWQKNHTNISGATTDFYQPTQSGMYNVMVAKNGCSSISDSISVTVIKRAEIPIAASASRCGNGSVTLSASSSTDTISWYDNQQNLLATGNSFTTSALSQTTIYFAQAGLTCASAMVADTVTINTTAIDPVTTNQSICGHGVITLTATSNDTVRWYHAPNGNLISTGDTLITPDINQTTIYFAQGGDACKSNFVQATAIVNPISADPISADQSRCDTGSITLTAISSDTIRWYDLPNGNLLSIGNSFTTPSINQTVTYYLRAEGYCPGNFIPVEAIVNFIPADPETADQSRCGEGSVMLAGTSSDTIRWYDSPNGNILSAGNNFATPVINQTTTYYVRTEGICLSNFVSVNAIVNAIPADPGTADQSRCGAGSVTLTAISTDTIRWYDSPDGNLLFTGNSFTSPIINRTAIYYARAEGSCSGNFISASAIINSLPVDPVVSSGSTCGAGSVLLAAISNDTVYWYDAPNGTLLVAGITFQTPMLTSSTTYFALAANGCTGNFVSAAAYVFPVSQVSLGNDTIIESGTIVNLDAGSGFSSYLWSTGEVSEIVALNSTGNYWVTVTDPNGCSATDTIQILVTVNVQPYVLAEGVLIYPNPTHSTISISFINSGMEDIFLRLVDENGKVVWSDFSINQKRVMRNIDLTQYAGGLYVFQIASPKSKREYKIVLK